MARISFAVTGQTTVELSVIELNQSTTYSSVFITCNGRRSPNLVRSGQNYSSDTWYLSGLTPGTTYYAEFTITSSGGSTATGGTSFTTQSPPRPNNWSWDTGKSSGSSFNLTASEWNRFTNRINQFREYKGYSPYSFTTVYSGNPVYAYQINEAIIGMRAMTTPPASVSSGSTAYASFLYSLSNALNSIY